MLLARWGVSVKRFTASEKWDKIWHRRLNCRLKCFWDFLCVHCDAAGVWEPDFEAASFKIGEIVTEKDLEAFEGKIIKLETGKWWIAKFVRFQYGELSPNCRPHVFVIETLRKHGLLERVQQGYESACKGYAKGCQTLQDKDKDQDQDKDLSFGKSENLFFDAGSPTWKAVQEYGSMHGVTAETCKAFFDHHESNRLWQNRFGKLINWTHKLIIWRDKDRTVKSKPLADDKINGAERVSGERELARIEDRLKTIRGQASEDAWGPHYNESQKAERKKLQARRDELKTRLGCLA